MTAIAQSKPFRFIDDQSSLDELLRDLPASTSAIALDAERASSFRYTSRAYLIQLYVQGIGAIVIDPLSVPDLTKLSSWANRHCVLLHSATQDLECLRELGIHPQHLFDTELAAKLLGKPKVGLQALLESELDIRIEKEHSAADWSKRPLPENWLTYAAQDVEHLLPLHALLRDQLESRKRMQWAIEEFVFLTSWQPKVITERWRRTSGLHKVKQRRHLAAVKLLWTARDEIASTSDRAPTKVLRDETLVELALSNLTSPSEIQTMLKQKYRVKLDYSVKWCEALETVRLLDDEELPEFHQRNPNALPPIKAWQEKNPAAAKRFQKARNEVLTIAEHLEIAPEVLINPETIRQVSWHFDHWDRDFLLCEFERLQTRPWQISLIFEDVFNALRHV